MQYLVTGKLLARSVRCGIKFFNLAKRGEKAPSSGHILSQHINTKRPQVYETIMKKTSLSATTKEVQAPELVCEKGETPNVESTIVLQLQTVDPTKQIQK